MASLPPLPLPASIRQRYVDLTAEPTCGLKIFILEAGDPGHPLILLFHGYPELAYTWRRVLLPLASQGFHVVAPDSRGYGRTTGWDASSHARASLAQFSPAQLVLDGIALARALGHADAASCVVGHDFGAAAAAACSLARPDLFRAAVFVSHAPAGSASLPPAAAAARAVLAAGSGGSTAGGRSDGLPRDADVHVSLARRPEPLKHYQWYNSTPTAARDWENPPQGMRAFLRGYLHLKSHVWKGNRVGMGRLAGWTADQLARMPGYYIMPLHATMPEVVESSMRGEDAELTKSFVTDDELDVYVREFARTGFQGMLNWYRSSTDARNSIHMAIFAGRKFEIPVIYIGGESDWGNYQRPGALEGLESGRVAMDYRGTKIFPGAGHWPQTEIPDILCREIVDFLTSNPQP